MTFNSNCNVCSRVVKGRDTTESYAFVEVCKNCINTCWQCGGDVGWLHPKMITIDSNNECEKCEHVGCKSCGINITCKECKMVICNSCIDDGKGCIRCRKTMRSLRKKYVDVL